MKKYEENERLRKLINKEKIQKDLKEIRHGLVNPAGSVNESSSSLPRKPSPVFCSK